jgi:hypothetical protein
MVVIVEREGTENIVVFVCGFTVVATVLLVPPVGVRVALCSILGRGVDVATVLRLLAGEDTTAVAEKADHAGIGELNALGFGHGSAGLLDELWAVGHGGRKSAGERTDRCNAPGEHAGQYSEACCRGLGR